MPGEAPLLEKARLLVAVLWAGSLWTVGYLVAPTLFATLDRTVAGTIAGTLFHAEAMLSLGCALALLVLLKFATSGWTPSRRRTVLALIAAMALCTVISHFGLQPPMAAAKAAGDTKLFGMLHGASSVIYLVQSLLAGWLTLKQ